MLVVDDDEALRELFIELIELRGLRAIGAANGREAFKHMYRGPLPSLIILDLEMPEMNGWQVLTQLRREPELARVPVAVVSGTDQRPRGATYFFQKPIGREELLQILRAHGAAAAGGP